MITTPFRAVLTAQARYLAPIVALSAIVTAALPLLTLQITEPAGAWRSMRVDFLLAQSSMVGPWYPAVAVALGVLFAWANWLPDVIGRWVYVFTLPLPRARMALLRLGAGAVLMIPAVLSLWIVGAIAAGLADLPPIIQAHAGALSLRFAAAVLVSYATTSLLVLFGRKVWYLFAVGVVVMLLGGLGLGFYNRAMEVLFLSPLSPFHVLAGYWLYLDV